MMALQAAEPRLILASSSATRQALLTRAGLSFEAIPAAVDEAALKEGAQAEGIPAEDAAIILAEAKAERDALVIGGDQLLPGISPNIGVYPTEPEADPLTEWLEATARFLPHARDDQLVLPGHKLPFTGLPFRLQQMAENHHEALARLRAHLRSPQTAAGCFPALYKRPIGEGEYGLALVEAVAHLNCLLRRGQVCRSLAPDGAWQWQSI